MRIALDTNPLFVTTAGTARYVRGLLRGFAELNLPDVVVDELAWPVANFGYRQPARAIRTAYRELVWGRCVAPRRLRQWRSAVLHSTHGLRIRSSAPTRRVSTLYDLAVLRHPERFRRWHVASSRRRLAQLPGEDAVVCISRFTASEALALLPVQPERLAVIACGCDFDDQSAEVRPAADLPQEFFLFVGSLEPGKNLDLLVRMYRLAESRGLTLPPLVIVGSRWAGVGREQAPPSSWFYLGHQPDTVLVYLYRRATALVFPSQYEGFGLPVVEAMALGCPVVCSPVASLPEVAGPAALFAAGTPDAYLDALRTLASSSARRGELMAAGRAVAAPFTWRAAAAATVDLYRRLIDPARSGGQ